MDPNLQAAIVSAVVSLVMSLLGVYPTARITAAIEAARDRRVEFRTRLQDILALAIEYPHLEHKHFCDGWRARALDDSTYWQYDTYCCMLFNLLEDVWTHARGKEAVMSTIVSYEEWFICHREWWLDNRQHNANGYGTTFYDFVETVVQAHNNTLQGRLK